MMKKAVARTARAGRSPKVGGSVRGWDGWVSRGQVAHTRALARPFLAVKVGGGRQAADEDDENSGGRFITWDALSWTGEK